MKMSIKFGLFRAVCVQSSLAVIRLTVYRGIQVALNTDLSTAGLEHYRRSELGTSICGSSYPYIENIETSRF